MVQVGARGQQTGGGNDGGRGHRSHGLGVPEAAPGGADGATKLLVVVAEVRDPKKYKDFSEFASRLSSPAPSGFGIEFKDTDL